MSCEVEARKITITLLNFEQSSGAFSWTLDQIKNPGSTKPSTPFGEVHFLDTDGFIVSSNSGKEQITNRQAAKIPEDKRSLN
jgi:hypothetical protein